MASVRIYTELKLPNALGKVPKLVPDYRILREDPEGEGAAAAARIVREIEAEDCCPSQEYLFRTDGDELLPDFSEIVLDPSDDPAADTRNIAAFHGALRMLPPALASTTGFWAWLVHNHYWKYVSQRAEDASWAEPPAGGGKKDSLEKTIRRDFFCQDDTKGKSLLANPLSRLWWAGRLIRDDANAGAPYAFAKLLAESGEGSFSSLILLFASSAAPRNHAVSMGIFSALQEWNDTHDNCFFGQRSIRNSLINCTAYLNQIGALRMVDLLSREEIKDILLQQLEKKWSKMD